MMRDMFRSLHHHLYLSPHLSRRPASLYLAVILLFTILTTPNDSHYLRSPWGGIRCIILA